MFDIHELLERQARWQKDRSSLSWAEKVRMAEAIRESVKQLRAGGTKANQGAGTDGPARAPGGSSGS